MEARREVLSEFAHQQGFDPLVAQNWYTTSRDFIKSDAVTRVHKVLSLFSSFFLQNHRGEKMLTLLYRKSIPSCTFTKAVWSKL